MKLSVIVPAYKDERTLGQCLESIRASNYADYELIVVDDASEDRTASIARSYADQVIEHSSNLGSASARNSGALQAAGEVLVFLDSDVVVRTDTLARIARCFTDQSDVDAVTGLFAQEHPNRGFFSQYKNLYMHFIFHRLPRKVTFVLGAVHAVRRDQRLDYRTNWTADTDLGQRMAGAGRSILFLTELEVVHLKEYSLGSLLRNDFLVPFDWGELFVRYQGWMQLGRRGTGYAHSPTAQLTSVVLTPWVIATGVLAALGTLSWFVPLGGSLICLLLNGRFFVSLTRARGLAFGVASVPVTFVDQSVMFAGASSGVIVAVLRRAWKNCRRQTSRVGP